MSYKQINQENSPFSVINGTFLIRSAGGSGMTFYDYLTEREYTYRTYDDNRHETGIVIDGLRGEVITKSRRNDKLEKHVCEFIEAFEDHMAEIESTGDITSLCIEFRHNRKSKSFRLVIQSELQKALCHKNNYYPFTILVSKDPGGELYYELTYGYGYTDKVTASGYNIMEVLNNNVLLDNNQVKLIVKQLRAYQEFIDYK